MPDQFISQNGAARVLTEVRRRVNHLVEFLSVFEIVREADFLKLVIKIVFFERNSDIEFATGQLLGVDQYLSELFIFVIDNGVVEGVKEELVHVILLFVEVCVARDCRVFGVLLVNTVQIIVNIARRHDYAASLHALLLVVLVTVSKVSADVTDRILHGIYSRLFVASDKT